MEPHELLRMYHAALASGQFSLADVNAEIKKTTDFDSYAALTRAVFEVDRAQLTAEATARVATREPGIGGLIASSLLDPKQLGLTGSPDPDLARGAEDFARTAAQGATLGFADEIAGMLGGDVEASRQRIEDLRTAEPVATALGEVAGTIPGLLIPGGAAVRAGGVARGAAVGAGVGAAAGAGVGIGEAEGPIGERLDEGLVGAGIGAAIGAPLGAGGVWIGRLLPRVFGKRGPRMAESLRRQAGVERSLDEAFDAVDNAKEAISRDVYQPIERAFKDGVDAPALIEALQQPELKTIVRSVSKDVQAGKRLPSFKELQSIRNKARGAGKRGSPEIGAAGDVLSQEMKIAIPGLTEADRSYATALSIVTALETSRAFVGRPAALARRALKGMSPDAQVAFREGMIHEFAQRLERRTGAGGKPSGMVRDMLEMGPEMRARLRVGFPNDEVYEQFLADVALERGAFALRKYTKWIIAGGIGYQLLSNTGGSNNQ